MQFVKKHWLSLSLGALTLVSLLLRLTNLQSTPPVISHDEVYYVVQAKTIALSGSDPSGRWRPWQLRPAHPLYAELPGLIMTPAALAFPDSPLLAARMTHVVFGLLIPLLLAGIVLKLFDNKRLALLTAVLATANPWLFQYSRMGFDSYFSLTFYLAGILTALSTKGKWRLLALIPFGLGFFQYQGLKVVFVPLVFTLSTYLIWRDKAPKANWPAHLKAAWPTLFLTVFSILLFGWFMTRVTDQVASTRVDDLIFFSDQHLAAKVNLERQTSITGPFQKVASNKLMAIFSEMRPKYLQAFNANLLFTDGEPLRNPFSVWSYGMFHPIDFFFVLIGLVVVWSHKKWRSQAWLLTALLLIAPLPSAINTKDAWIMFRSSLMVPILTILLSLGVYKLWYWLPKYLKPLLPAAYLMFAALFFYHYFYRLPIIGTQGQYFGERVMASYIDRQPERKVIVLASETEFVFEELLAFTNPITRENIAQLNQAYRDQKFSLANFTVETSCLNPDLLYGNTTIITDNSVTLCDDKELPVGITTSSIASILDSGAQFTIYGDELCAPYGLNRFINITENRMAVEKLDNSTFCQTFLVD